MLPPLALKHHQGPLRIDAVAADLHGPRAVGDVRGDFERDPKAGQPRHRHSMGTKVEHVLGVSRIQYGHSEVSEQEL